MKKNSVVRKFAVMTVISASVALAGCSDDDDDPVVLDDSAVTTDDELVAGETTGDDTSDVPADMNTETDPTTDAEPDVTLGDSPEVESGTETVTDSEGEGGTDAEGEAGSDAEGEAGTDAEGEAGTDADGEAGTDAEGEAGGDAEGEAGTDAEGEAGSDAEGEAGTDAEGEAGSDAEGEGGTEAESEGGTEAEGEGGSDAEGEAGTDTESSDALTPGVGNTALDFIVNSDDHSTLAGLLLANEALATTLDNPEQQFTIFAPTDAAIDALDQEIIDFLSAPENEAALERVLRYHVVAGSVQSMAIIDGVVAAESGQFSVPTLAEGEPAQSLTFTANAEGTGYNITDSLNITVPLTGPLDQNLSTDIEAPTTGIVHVIENVLRPAQAAAVVDAGPEE